LSQFIHAHSGSNGYRSNLSDIDRTLTDNMTAQDPGSGAVNDQFAEAGSSTVDDRARGRVEAHNRCDNIVAFSRLLFRDTHVRVLRIGKASDRIHRTPGFQLRAPHRVSGGHKTVLYCLRYKHYPTRDIAGCEDVWNGSSEITVHAYKAALIGVYPRRREIQPCS